MIETMKITAVATATILTLGCLSLYLLIWDHRAGGRLSRRDSQQQLVWAAVSVTGATVITWGLATYVVVRVFFYQLAAAGR